MYSYPLRLANGDVIISNSQGYLINSLKLNSGSIPPFSVVPQNGKHSDTLKYYRHSFETYCADHQPGGAREVDPIDPNWHKDGTPHVDYSTLIFAITGRFKDGSVPAAGSVSFDMNVDIAVAK